MSDAAKLVTGVVASISSPSSMAVATVAPIKRSVAPSTPNWILPVPVKSVVSQTAIIVANTVPVTAKSYLDATAPVVAAAKSTTFSNVL